MNFSSNLKYLREQKGLNQADLAKVLGVKQPTVGNWEAGKREPELSVLAYIATYFEVTIDDLILNNLRPVMPLYTVNLRYLRKKHKMTQDDMANLLGYRGKQGYSMIETGKSGISIENLEKLADFFGVTLDQMVKQDLSKESV